MVISLLPEKIRRSGIALLYHEHAFMGIAKTNDSCYNFHMNDTRIFSFDPIVDENSRILILGTMPSVKSLEESFYYAHPRNAFWPIMSDCFACSVPATVEEKKTLLLSNRIALWDTARSCMREGSLDSAMRETELNDFDSFFRRYPGIEKVLLNGGTAWALYHRLPKELVEARPCVKMPSTSPAYTMNYEKKLEIWKREIIRGGERT